MTEPTTSSGLTTALDLYQLTWNNGWGTWNQLVGCAAGGISALSTGYNSIDVYTQGMDHGAVWHDRYGSNPSGSGPAPYCCGLPGFGCCAAGDQPHACRQQDTGDAYCNPASNKCETCGTQPGQTCCNWPDAQGPVPRCEAGLGLVCNIADNTCVSNVAPSGGNLQVCNHGTCNSGLTCVGYDPNRNISGYCKPNTSSCGVQGASCSSNGNCCSGYQCVSGKCASSTSPAAKTCGGNAFNGQTQVYNVGVRDPYSRCAVTELYVYANSSGEAQSCGQSALPGYDILVQQSYSQYNYAQWSPLSTPEVPICNPLSLDAFSQDDANACAYHTCTNCNNVPNGTCP